ncbi:MAG TPA: sigma-70 family RNA polymerase sigma factor, partial [Acidimicrobiales bacterium]|nr:sigma-70 family RNA polymerase sigma factor [Acidimicrobiales bacterium]
MALITELDDRTLVERHRAGDEDAFRRIVERHHRSLYANALRRLGDPVLAEDAVQEAFLRAFRNLDRFDGAYHLDAWLHRIVTNTCHDIGRRQGRDTRLFDRACTRVETQAPAADEEFDATPRDELTDALDQLPESYREVLLLRFVDEMSYEDVALKAGISEQNARARVSRGRTML